MRTQTDLSAKAKISRERLDAHEEQKVHKDSLRHMASCPFLPCPYRRIRPSYRGTFHRRTFRLRNRPWLTCEYDVRVCNQMKKVRIVFLAKKGQRVW